MRGSVARRAELPFAVKWLAGVMLSLVACSASGCLDGPLHQMKKLNPFIHKEWNADRVLGPTFEDRLAELRLLDGQVEKMSTDNQDRWASLLAKIATKDPSPEMRSRAVLTLSRVAGDQSLQALNTASSDEVEKVRLAVCKAWKKRGDSAARDMLLSLAQADGSVHVRQAAIQSLSGFNEPEVRNALGTMLEDRSPAVQHQAVRTLQTLSGRNYGGDFAAWRKYVAGEDVPEPENAQLTSRLFKSLPWTK